MTEIPADVVQYLTMQMTKLHQNNIQVALKVASCFGSQFDLLTFKKAKVTGVALEEFLPILASSGFLQASSESTNRLSRRILSCQSAILISGHDRRLLSSPSWI
mmetsp:Transcript_2684/g.4975  ORF Transcript_2684/g.4975 Transcript_2684/m.4975 type:complete len:104 (+) Transcript_2684:1134-1445(+)